MSNEKQVYNRQQIFFSRIIVLPNTVLRSFMRDNSPFEGGGAAGEGDVHSLSYSFKFKT